MYRARHPSAPEPQVTFHPFELNPDVPREGIARVDYIAKKFGARGYSAHDRLVQAGAPLGIAFAFERIERQPNTLACHALIEWARRRGVQGVPFFIFNQRLAVEGAQAPEVLLDAMLEAGKESAAA